MVDDPYLSFLDEEPLEFLDDDDAIALRNLSRMMAAAHPAQTALEKIFAELDRRDAMRRQRAAQPPSFWNPRPQTVG